MARIIEPTAAQMTAWREWVASRPEAVRLVAERLDPWSLYRIARTGQRVTIRAFTENADGRVLLRVFVSGRFNLTAFEREVFGVPADDLEPCDLPDPSEPVGAAFTTAEAIEHLDEIRVAVRPDLWEKDETGRAVRKRTH